MTELIWVLLAIDVLAKASKVLITIISFTFTIVTTVTVIYSTFIIQNFGSKGLLQYLRKTLKPFVVMLSALLFIYTLIPSKQTMQIALGLYATNQAVTYVADTDIAKQALSTLELKLKTIEQDLKKDLEEQDSGNQ